MSVASFRKPAVSAVSRRSCVVARAERMFTDAEWDAAIKTAAMELDAMKVAAVADAPAADMPAAAAAASTKPAGRVFSDEEWDTAIKKASRAAAFAAETAAARAAPAAGAPAPAPAVKPAGRTFSDEEWDAAIRSAGAELAALRAASGAASEAAPAESAMAYAPAPEGRVFSDAEWDAAIKAAARAAELAQLQRDGAVGAPVETKDIPSFGDVMAFGGPAPEAANGRIAMLAFVAAAAAELSSGESVAQQFADATPSVVAAAAALSLATLVPLLKGNPRNEAFGPFSPEAETINGRAAMIGLAALILIESSKGSALF